MLYAELPKGMDHYSFALIAQGGKGANFNGMIKDAELSYPFQIELGAGGTGEAIKEKLGSYVDNIAEILTGDKLTDNLEMFTVKKVKNFSNPTFTVNAVFYEGLSTPSGSVGDFKTFMQKVATTMLPAKSGAGPASVLSSNQTDWNDYLRLLSNVDAFSGKQKVGYRLRLGRFLNITSGLFITDISVKQPMVLGKSGQPLVWEASFTVEYYKQITVDEMTAWFI